MSQWRKFESKRSYIFEDINFWIFWIFWNLFWFFTSFSDFNSFKKGQKGWLFPARTAELMWRGMGHVAEPREPTRTPAWCWCGAARTRGGATRAHADAWVAPTGREEWLGWKVMGPGEFIGAVTQWLKSLPPFIHTFSAYFFLWDYVPYNFEIAGHVESRGTLDAIASTEVRRSCGLGSTRLSSQARAQRRTVDRVSDVGRSRFNCAFGNRGAIRGHIRVFQSVFARSWDHGPQSLPDSGRRSVFSEFSDFCAEFPYKYQCSSFEC